jgi:hypothetical protein
VRNVIFVDLDRDPLRDLFAGKLGLAADANDGRVVRARGYELVEGFSSDDLEKQSIANSLSLRTERTVSASMVKIYS